MHVWIIYLYVCVCANLHCKAIYYQTTYYQTICYQTIYYSSRLCLAQLADAKKRLPKGSNVVPFWLGPIFFYNILPKKELLWSTWVGFPGLAETRVEGLWRAAEGTAKDGSCSLRSVQVLPGGFKGALKLDVR